MAPDTTHTYHGFLTSEDSVADAQGYGRGVSTDGQYRVGDKGSRDSCTTCSQSTAPDYAPQDVKDSWPHLTYEQTYRLVSIAASSDGASDGWKSPKGAF